MLVLFMNLTTLRLLSSARQYEVGKLDLKYPLFAQLSSQNEMFSSLPGEIDVKEDDKWPTFKTFYHAPNPTPRSAIRPAAQS